MNLQISRRSFLACLGALLLLLSFGVAARAENYQYLLGDTTITIKVLENGSGPTFVCPHDNENTASRIAASMVRSHGGVLVELSHSGERNITFTHGGVRYVFDPNRMFTDAGIRASLESLGGTYSQEGHAMVKSFASAFKQYFRPGLIIAVHNNTNGNYSHSSYEEGGDMHREGREVYTNPDIDPDNFFFVTTASLFENLKAKNFNVVLQSRRPTNDGSLSVYAASKGIRYVNVETQAGNAAAQKAMIEALL